MTTEWSAVEELIFALKKDHGSFQVAFDQATSEKLLAKISRWVSDIIHIQYL
jgi:hypothetical protein